MDIIAALGPWLKEVQPRFGPAIAPRFASIYDFTAADVAAAQVLRDKRRRRLADFFVTRPDAIIIVPSALCGFATWARRRRHGGVLPSCTGDRRGREPFRLAASIDTDSACR
jgi:hypothetical protein